jgi:hypothetical protein
MTITLAVLAIMTAISLVTASSNGFVILAFAVKNGGGDKSSTSSSDKSSSSTSKKGTLSGATGASTGSKSKFIKCTTAISGSLSRTDVDNFWDQVFGGSGSSSASRLTLVPSTSTSDSSSKHSS